MTQSDLQALKEHEAALSQWLDADALPLWLTRGYAPQTGFVETVAQNGQPTKEHVRGRVNPRQIFTFAEAGRRGWRGGDWQSAVEAALLHADRVLSRPDGFYGLLATVDGRMVDERFDLYVQAFVLLAYRGIAGAVDDRREEMLTRAMGFLDRLERGYAHPLGGFQEAIPPKLPLRANPHMHLFEAMLAWESVIGGRQGRFSAIADQIASLCLSHMIDPATQAVLEFFDADWRPVDGVGGNRIEPGHQFEWAWLLARWSLRRGRTDGIDRARRLFEIGERHGIDPGRNAAVMALDTDFRVTDPMARLWSQTEWLKAALILATLSQGGDRARYIASAARAAATIRRALKTPVAGLWLDKQRPDGRYVDEPAPASTFYHLALAIWELRDRLHLLEAERTGTA